MPDPEVPDRYNEKILKQVRIPVELPGKLATVLREARLGARGRVDRLVREHAVVASVLRNASRSGIWTASMVWLY